MYKECPNHIMKLYEYDIIENCNHKHKDKYVIDSMFKEENPTYYDTKMNSKYCLRMIYSFVDTTIDKYKKKLLKENKEVWYSLFIQYFYVVYCMRKKGYTHNDIHGNNIGIVFTKNKTIILFKTHNIPTFGYKLVLLDYGLVLNEKYDMNNEYFLKNEKYDMNIL